MVNWPLGRASSLSAGASLYVRLITGLPLSDCTGGFKCFRRGVLEAIDLGGIKSDGYAFQVELNYKAWRRGFKIAELLHHFHRPYFRPELEDERPYRAGGRVAGLGP